MSHEEDELQKRVSLPRKETSNFPLPISPEKNEEKADEEAVRYADGEKGEVKDRKNYSFCGVLGTKKSRSGSQES
jgi:hypothetical protein